MTPLDERSAGRRDLYLTTQTFMPPAGFETAIPASQLPHTHALDRAVTRTGAKICASVKTLFCGNFLLLLDPGRECVPGQITLIAHNVAYGSFVIYNAVIFGNLR